MVASALTFFAHAPREVSVGEGEGGHKVSAAEQTGGAAELSAARQ